jgi:acetyl-CoA C-acetyltransferase
MIETAENLRRTYSIPREEQDRYALRSHERATNAQVMGNFNDEIVPIRVRRGRTEELFVVDEHPRADVTIGALAALPALSAASDPEATVTAGNASGQNDAAAVCIVTDRHTSDDFGLRAMVRVRGWAVAGVEPNVMGLGPVPATEAALRRADLAMSDMDLIELNEAFAAQVLACTREWRFAEADFDRLNVNGSGISLGHPVGATGARILATLAHEMVRRQARFALETMCIGGGQGIAAVFERVS